MKTSRWLRTMLVTTIIIVSRILQHFVWIPLHGKHLNAAGLKIGEYGGEGEGCLSWTWQRHNGPFFLHQCCCNCVVIQFIKCHATHTLDGKAAICFHLATNFNRDFVKNNQFWNGREERKGQSFCRRAALRDIPFLGWRPSCGIVMFAALWWSWDAVAGLINNKTTGLCWLCTEQFTSTAPSPS